MSHGAGPAQWDLFSLARVCLGRDKITLCKYIGGKQQREEIFFIIIIQFQDHTGTRTDGYKLATNKFVLEITRKS